MICKKCGLDKPETEFYPDKSVKSGLMSKCKECTKQAVKKRAEEKKPEILEYHRKYYKTYKEKQRMQDAEYKLKIRKLKTPCVKCGETRRYVIDFHHIDPKQKSFNINRKSSKSDFSIIEKEALKCVSLCRNCHSEFHYFYGVIPKDPIGDLEEYLGKKLEIANGTL